MVAFLIYSVYELVVSLLNINKKAYIDSKTKLFNKAYWEDLVRDVFSAEEQTAMIMFDLNGLKHTNDTLGHNAGAAMNLRRLCETPTVKKQMNIFRL